MLQQLNHSRTQRQTQSYIYVVRLQLHARRRQRRCVSCWCSMLVLTLLKLDSPHTYVDSFSRSLASTVPCMWRLRFGTCRVSTFRGRAQLRSTHYTVCVYTYMYLYIETESVVSFASLAMTTAQIKFPMKNNEDEKSRSQLEKGAIYLCSGLTIRVLCDIYSQPQRRRWAYCEHKTYVYEVIYSLTLIPPPPPKKLKISSHCYAYASQNYNNSGVKSSCNTARNLGHLMWIRRCRRHCCHRTRWSLSTVQSSHSNWCERLLLSTRIKLAKTSQTQVYSNLFSFFFFDGAIYSASITAAIQMYWANVIADGQEKYRKERKNEVKRPRRQRWFWKYTKTDELDRYFMLFKFDATRHIAHIHTT